MGSQQYGSDINYTFTLIFHHTNNRAGLLENIAQLNKWQGPMTCSVFDLWYDAKVKLLMFHNELVQTVTRQFWIDTLSAEKFSLQSTCT